LLSIKYAILTFLKRLSGSYFLLKKADDIMIENKKLVISIKMPVSKEELQMIKGLKESKNYSSRKFLRELPEKHLIR